MTALAVRLRPLLKPALRLGLLLALVAFLLTTRACHNRLFLFPSSTIAHTPSEHDLGYEDVSFPNAAGKQLRGWYFAAQDPLGAVVLNHGNHGNIGGYLDYAACLTHARISLLLYDYQGFGKSEGGASVGSLVTDGLAAFDYLAARPDAPAKIAVMGVSLGTPVSCAVAAARPQSCALVLEGAFSPAEELYWRFGTLGSPMAFIISRTMPRIRPADDLRKLAGRPLLMVHGSADRTTPVAGAAALFESAPNPKWMWVIDGLQHFPAPIFYKPSEYGRVLAAFLEHAFAGRPFEQPAVTWAASKLGSAPWQVAANVTAVPAGGTVTLVVTTADNKTVRKEIAPGDPQPVSISVGSRPVGVSAFAEPASGSAEPAAGSAQDAPRANAR